MKFSEIRPILKNIKEADERVIHLSSMHNVGMCGNCINLRKANNKCEIDHIIHNHDAIACENYNLKPEDLK